MVNKATRWFSVFIIFTCVFSLFCAAYTLLDPDFSWHLRFGTDILQSGFKYTDQYSYTMPSFHFVDHSWMMSVSFAVIYKYLHLGYIGESLFVAFIGTVAAILSANSLVWLIPLVTASYLNGFDVRSSVATLLFFPLLILVSRKVLTKKGMYLFALPLIMLLWANFHGGFFLGVIYVWGFCGFEALFNRKRWIGKELFHLFLVVILSTLATLVTPYQADTWIEALRTMNNPLLRTYIAEWQPIQSLPSMNALLIVALFITALWYDSKITWLKVFALLLAVESFTAIRILPLFCTAACFVIADAYRHFEVQAKKRIDKSRLTVLLFCFSVLGTIIFTVESVLSVKARIELNRNAYPILATEYLKKNPPAGNIFSLLIWNSYLDEHLPQTRVFLDGRMLVWKQKEIPGQLTSAFQTYLDITHEKIMLIPILNQYCVTDVLWFNSEVTPEGSYMSIAPIDITRQLDKTEWKLQYSDSISVIYQRELPLTCELQFTQKP